MDPTPTAILYSDRQKLILVNINLDDNADDCSKVDLATCSWNTHQCVCPFARVVQAPGRLSASLVAGYILGKTSADKAEVLVHSLGSEDFVYTLRTYPVN